MHRCYLLLFVILNCVEPVFSQDFQINTLRDSIAWYADIMQYTDRYEHRKIAETQLSHLLYGAFRKDTSFKKQFPEAPGYKLLYNQDSTFRILTWQLIDASGEGRFYGLFQEQGELPVRLNDVSMHVGELKNLTSHGDRWMGIVYEEIIPYGKPEDSTYIFIGSGVVDKFSWKHIAESVAIKNGVVVFGVDAFQKQGQSYDRLIIRFSAGTGVSMQYMPEKKIIIFDNLNRVYDPVKGRALYVPNGTYDAYKLKGNTWNFVHYVLLKPGQTVHSED